MKNTDVQEIRNIGELKELIKELSDDAGIICWGHEGGSDIMKAEVYWDREGNGTELVGRLFIEPANGYTD